MSSKKLVAGAILNAGLAMAVPFSDANADDVIGIEMITDRNRYCSFAVDPNAGRDILDVWDGSFKDPQGTPDGAYFYFKSPLAPPLNRQEMIGVNKEDFKEEGLEGRIEFYNNNPDTPTLNFNDAFGNANTLPDFLMFQFGTLDGTGALNPENTINLNDLFARGESINFRTLNETPEEYGFAIKQEYPTSATNVTLQADKNVSARINKTQNPDLYNIVHTPTEGTDIKVLGLEGNLSQAGVLDFKNSIILLANVANAGGYTLALQPYHGVQEDLVFKAEGPDGELANNKTQYVGTAPSNAYPITITITEAQKKATCFVNSLEGKFLGERIVDAGLAWAKDKYNSLRK